MDGVLYPPLVSYNAHTTCVIIYNTLLWQIIFHNHCITIIRGTLASYYTMGYPADNSINTEKLRGRVYN